MNSGAFEVLEIGYDVDQNELFRATGSLQLSLAWKKSERIVAGSIGLCVIVAFLSILALIRVCRRRFEMFSSVSLILFSAASLAISALHIVIVVIMQRNAIADNYDADNCIGGEVAVLILALMTSFPLFATNHCLFALQYLRASLTVPLYFDRQIAKDSNCAHKLPEFDAKIRNRKWCVVTSQTVLVLAGLSFTACKAF